MYFPKYIELSLHEMHFDFYLNDKSLYEPLDNKHSVFSSLKNEMGTGKH